MAMEVRDQLKLPTYYLFYENYTLSFDETVSQVLDFLEMEAVHPPLEFYVGKTYRSFFKPEHAKMAAEFTKEFASPRVWELLAHYFDGLDAGDDDTTVDAEFDLAPTDETQVKEIVEGDTDDDSVVENIDGGSTETTTGNDGSDVVWLLSFPNSVRRLFGFALRLIELGCIHLMLSLYHFSLVIGHVVHNHKYGTSEQHVDCVKLR